MIDCRPKSQREEDEDELLIKERGIGVPRTDVERVMSHYGVDRATAEHWLTVHPVDVLVPKRGTGIERGTAAALPSAFERAFAVPALANPRLVPFDTVPYPYIDVQPLSFNPGDRIDLAVFYAPANDEESMWQTVVNVIQAGSKLVQERQHHISMNPGKTRADCDTGLTMPSTPVTLEVEVWGHPDYFETTWPDP